MLYKRMDSQAAVEELELAQDECCGTQHWRSMALDTLRPGEAFKRFQRLNWKQDCRKNILRPFSLTTEGIELAQPASLCRFLNPGLHKLSSRAKTCDDLERHCPWVPEVYITEIAAGSATHANRTSNNLRVDDIKGARPNPKNMKLGCAARGTSPLEPVYKLPSCNESPPAKPKFLRDNLNVEDISGAKPKQQVQFLVDSLSSREVVEGSFPGWRPAHRRRFGKTARDLCLQVHDINRPVRRMIRSRNSQVYLEIKEIHSKHLKQFDCASVRSNHSLQNNDIQGANACSGTWLSDVDRRKGGGIQRVQFFKQKELAESFAKELLKEKLKGRWDGEVFKRLCDIFKQLDRDRSGKLTQKEVATALKKLEVQLNTNELNQIRTAFDSDLDGFIHYRKLLHTTNGAGNTKHNQMDRLNSSVVSLCLNQWVEKPPWPGAPLKHSSYRGQKAHSPSSRSYLESKNIDMKQPNDIDMIEHHMNEAAPEMGKPYSNQEIQPTEVITAPFKVNSFDNENISDGCLKEISSSCKFPFQLGLQFWPDEKSLQGPHEVKAYFSLPQDFKEPSHFQSKPLLDADKRWEKNVGGTLFTGEGNNVIQGSYMTGNDWSRPSIVRMQSKKRRVSHPQSLHNFAFFPELEWQSRLLSTARTENSSKPFAEFKDLRRPLSASQSQNFQRPASTRNAQFFSPRSVLLSPASSRSSWSPRSTVLWFESTPRNHDHIRSSCSACIMSFCKSHAEKLSEKLQSLKREDTEAVRALF